MTNMNYSPLLVMPTKTDLLMPVNSTIASSLKKMLTELLSVVKPPSNVHVLLNGTIHLSLVKLPGNVVISCIFLEKLPITKILMVMVTLML